ncbi:uncharacterized protein LOC110369012 [Fundulus heteroclitus]|uniref:uncharacterized protein LOC110369012 n=1 Tax=Fundulus heteroclitus TaxID=8078 RepID=UPI00165B09A3|nr:uncharacterized protein LOC110369012 [Fundulus heteroclitus]
MGKVLFAVVAAFASLSFVESLICNKCSFGMMGKCMNLVNETCSTNSSVCYSGKSAFPMLPDSMGLRSLGCKENSTGCDVTTNGTLMGFTYESHITCCSTDNCNPITVSGAPTTKITLTAAVGGAILALVRGNIF